VNCLLCMAMKVVGKYLHILWICEVRLKNWNVTEVSWFHSKSANVTDW